MTTDPIQLLRTLVNAGRGLPERSAQGSIEGSGFAALLKQAQTGELTTRDAVTIDPDVSVELSDEQMLKLSVATDKAEAAGVQTALVLVDGKRLVLDVRQRRITGEASVIEGTGIVSGVDGVIDLAAQASETPRGIFGPLVLPGAEGASGRKSSGPPVRSENASVLKLLAELKKAQ